MFCRTLVAEEPAPPPPNPPSVREISPGVVEIAGIRVEQERRTVTLKAEVELLNSLLEYAVVNQHGKLHESVLSTKVEPMHLHTAMLLLGARDAKEYTGEAPPAQITAEFLEKVPKIEGDPVRIRVRWVDPEGKTVEKPLSDLILNNTSEKPMPDALWIYNGSILHQGKFLAQHDRSLIALISDPTALINNTSADRDTADIWSVNTKIMPPRGTPLELEIQLLTPTKP